MSLKFLQDLNLSSVEIDAPNAPTNLSLTVVGDTINVTFTASTTTNIDYYLIFGSVAGGDYGLVSVIPPADFANTMSTIDNSFDTPGTQSYRMYAVRGGKYSSALFAPNLDISVILPASFSGFKILHKLINSSAFKVGPHFIPIGFFIPRQNSTWAPSGCLVLSPIQTK